MQKKDILKNVFFLEYIYKKFKEACPNEDECNFAFLLDATDIFNEENEPLFQTNSWKNGFLMPNEDVLTLTKLMHDFICGENSYCPLEYVLEDCKNTLNPLLFNALINNLGTRIDFANSTNPGLLISNVNDDEYLPIWNTNATYIDLMNCPYMINNLCNHLVRSIYTDSDAWNKFIRTKHYLSKGNCRAHVRIPKLILDPKALCNNNCEENKLYIDPECLEVSFVDFDNEDAIYNPELLTKDDYYKLNKIFQYIPSTLKGCCPESEKILNNIRIAEKLKKQEEQKAATDDYINYCNHAKDRRIQKYLDNTCHDYIINELKKDDTIDLDHLKRNKCEIDKIALENGMTDKEVIEELRKEFNI